MTGGNKTSKCFNTFHEASVFSFTLPSGSLSEFYKVEK